MKLQIILLAIFLFVFVQIQATPVANPNEWEDMVSRNKRSPYQECAQECEQRINAVIIAQCMRACCANMWENKRYC
uniref:Uncharacterized protein n=1 Tax=Acrobeloides nanus TaxID=290746 RepID=A0A914DKL5_9BILA